MWKLNKILGFCLLLSACQSGKTIIEGSLKDANVSRVYLCEVLSEYYGSLKPIDSVVVVNGKFSMRLDSLTPQLYYLKAGDKAGGLFIEPGKIQVVQGESADEKIIWEVRGSASDALYRKYLEEEEIATYKRISDSLDQLFYVARAADNREEMARIKEESIPYYEKGEQNKRKVAQKWADAHKNSPFGAYIYYTRIFNRSSFPTLERVEQERQYISTFAPEVQNCVYADKMKQKLNDYAGCAIGAIAPEIQGLDTLDQPLKLSDLRGQYVILDFWNSYCHWCREETPWLKAALEYFGKEKLTVLGISSDRFKKNWVDAIHEDQSYWHHLMLQKGDDVMDRYCIKGIPHTVLVDPDGKILAKDFRQKEIIPELEKWIQ